MDKILSYLPENVHVRFGWKYEMFLLRDKIQKINRLNIHLYNKILRIE